MIVTFSKLLFSKELPLSRMVIRIELAVLPVVSHIFVILLVSIALVLFTIAFCPIHIAAAGRRVRVVVLPLKRCNAPACRSYVDWAERYCEKHKGYADKQYNKDVRYNRENSKLY